jgi:hypothetical protein
MPHGFAENLQPSAIGPERAGGVIGLLPIAAVVR